MNQQHTAGPFPPSAKASLNADYARTEIGRWQARSMAMSTGGVVAAKNPLAAQAGAVVLARGGHAVDVAIAANAVMGVVAPMMNGVGGDLFAIVHDAATDSVHGLNASGWSPAPRFVKLTFAGTDVMMEARFPESVRQKLARRGHEIDLQGEFSNMVGGGEAVMRDQRARVNYGASDPRKDGAAIPEPIV